MSSISRLQAPVKTIGFVVDWMDGVYQNQILEGARDAALDRGVHLLCFAGGMLRNELRGGARRNATFDVIGPESVDGVILMAGTIGNRVGTDELLAYCERFGRIPRASIAVELPGIASILVDNRTGIESAITHLIRTHSCQKIAFVRGPDANPEAELRYGVYRSTLTANGIEIDEQLIAPGEFLAESGRRAVATFYDDRKQRPDAIVAANDQMAIGVLEALAARGIRVPDDVAVVGFDDIEEARFTSPPLTTVRQPLYEQGREAVRLVLSGVYGGSLPERVTLHTEFVARRSCRCFAEGSRLPAAGFPKRASFEAALVERRQLVLADLARAARGSFGILGSGWEARLVGALTSDLRGDTTTAFRLHLEGMLIKLLEQRSDFNLSHDVLSVLRKHLLSCVEADPERRAQVEDLFHEARLLIGQVSERAQAQQKLAIAGWAGALVQTGAALLASTDVSQLQAAVAEHFPLLGIKSCYLALYGADIESPSELLIAYNENARPLRLESNERRPRFLPRKLLDAGVAKGFYVATVYSAERVLGYLLLDLGKRDGVVYEALREFLNAALRGVELNRLSRATQPPGP